MFLFPCGVTSSRDSCLVLLQKPGGPLWPRNGWVSATFELLDFCFLDATEDAFHSAINAPSTGNTFEAYLAAAKALGSNEQPVSHSLVLQAFHVLTIHRTISAFRLRPGNGWCGCSGVGYPRCSRGRHIELVRVEIEFVREPPCCQWLVRPLGCGIWHNSRVRM